MGGSPTLPCSPIYMHTYMPELGLSLRSGVTCLAAGDGAEPVGPGTGRGWLREVEGGGQQLPQTLHSIFLQLLWDLELLTGAGLGLFWPPQAQFHNLWDQKVRSQWDMPQGSTVGGSELLRSRVSWGMRGVEGSGSRSVGFRDRAGSKGMRSFLPSRESVWRGLQG